MGFNDDDNLLVHPSLVLVKLKSWLEQQRWPCPKFTAHQEKS
jgi:hypothetical protein